MAEHYQCVTDTVRVADYQIFFRIYRNSRNPQGRRILMLHGAGVNGSYTWEPLLHHLHSWGEILVPDLRGMGESLPVEEGRVLTRAQAEKTEPSYELTQILDDLDALVSYIGWSEMDLAGYSFGGLIAMLAKQRHPERFRKTYLLEPALLERADHDALHQVFAGYKEVAESIRTVPRGQQAEALIQIAIVQFLDLISPVRSMSARMEHATIHRLMYRARGFSLALSAVVAIVDTLDRTVLIEAQDDVICFAGKRSPEALRLHYQAIMDSRSDWRYCEIVGADHSLPFQKPSRIADIFERSVQNF